MSVPVRQASKVLYLFFSWRVVLTASMTKTLRNIVNGDRSRLTIVNDISVADISLVRKFGRHSGTMTLLKGNWLQLGEWDDEFIFLLFQCQFSTWMWDVFGVVCIDWCLDVNKFFLLILVSLLQVWKVNDITDAFELKTLFYIFSPGTALQQTSKEINNSAGWFENIC